MDTGDGLLQAIVDEPDDDSLRLIYADWLQDHGQPDRAEFIRLEIAMHPHFRAGLAPDRGDDPEYDRLNVRWEELVDQHSGNDWFADLLPLVKRYFTARGFVCSITTGTKQFAQQADEILAAAPLLERVFLERESQYVTGVARRPELVRIRTLSFFKMTLGHARLRELCQSPYLHRLRSLEAIDARIDHPGARALADSPVLAGLEEIDLSGNPFGDSGAQALLAPRALPNLRVLELHDCGLGDDVANALLRTELPQLKVLNLGLNALTSVGAEALAQSPRLSGLESLTLFGSELGTGVRALADSPYLGRLRYLGLGCIEPDDASLATLLRSNNLAQVEELLLGGNHLGTASLDALASAPALGRVRKLQVGAYGFGAETLHRLAHAHLPALRELDLSVTSLEEVALRRLLAGPLLAQVTHLNLRDCDLRTASAEALAGAAALANLRILCLDNNRIGNKGALALASSPYLNRLVRLNLAKNSLSESGRKALVDRFGVRVCNFTAEE